MKHKFKTFILIICLVFGFMMNVHAETTIKEDADTYTGDVYIIGSSKFDSNVIVTGTMASVAGAREAYIQYLVNQNYNFKPEDVRIYYYSELAESWSLLPATSEDEIKELNEEETKKLTDNLNIYYVNEEEKVLEIPYQVELKEGQKLVFSTNSPNMDDEIKFENGKLSIPASVVWVDIILENSDETSIYLETFEQVETEFVNNTVTVKTLEELKNAITSEKSEIKLAADITDITETITIPYEVYLNGAGYKLTFKDVAKTNGSASGLVIAGDYSSIDNLTIEMDGKDGWQGNYGLQVYDAEWVSIYNYKGTKADAALLVNASTVSLHGNIDVTGNEFGGIEVSKGTAEGLKNSTLTLNGTVVMDDEAINKPIMWIEKGQGTIVNYEGIYVANTAVPAYAGKEQTFFYTSESVYNEMTVTTADELQTAMSLPFVQSIKLLDHIELSTILEVKRDLILDLNGYTLTSFAEEVLKVNGVNNTLKITNGNIVAYGSATLFVGTKEQDGKYNKLIIDENVKITGEEYGIYVVGDQTEVDFNGELKTTADDSIAILGSGNAPCANTIINVGKTAKIDATQKGSFAFYLPQAGTVTINGGTIKGDTVVGIKAGTLTINGGMLTATGEKAIPEGYNNGIYNTGDVIIIEENEGYADNIRVFVAADATLTSINGYAIQEHLYSGENRAVVTGKYAATNKLDTGAYYTESAKAQAKISEVLYGNLQEALDNASNGETVVLLNDVTYEDCDATPLKYQATSEDRTAVVDLNGKTVAATVNNTQSMFLLEVGSVNADKNDGTATLRIMDSSEDMTGTLTVMPNKESSAWKVSVATISVGRLGRLIVDSGNIITVGGDSNAKNPYAIDVKSNTGPQTAELTINGGYLESKTGMGVRLFGNSATGAAKFTMNGGEIVAGSSDRGVWLQQSGGSTYHLVEFTMNGGKITAGRALEVGDFNKETETPSENIKVVLNKGELVSTNAVNNNKHPECDDLTTSMSTEWYNMVFTHVKITDNRNK